MLDNPPPLIQLPAPLFIGSTSIRGASTHFGKVTRPDGVMLQLGQRSSDRDVWLWVPAGTSHNQASPWSSALTLSHWRECNELHFVTVLKQSRAITATDAKRCTSSSTPSRAGAATRKTGSGRPAARRGPS